MKITAFAFVALAFLTVSFKWVKPTSTSTEHPKIDSTKIIEWHNFYRQKMGAPDIHWSEKLAEYAQSWANKLSKNCNLQHSNGSYGENIYWKSEVADEFEVVDYWASEEKYFNHKNTTYVHPRSSKSGHYSQVIWAKSSLVGAGVANCSDGGQIWVCVYDPPGNMIGEKAY